MKKIGILFGQERSFPQALAERINREGSGVVAEPALLGGIGLQTPKKYDLVLDRISQDIPFYRAALKKLSFDGTIVVNDPFWWSADDKFFNNVVAESVGVAVPKTVLLPSHEHPPDTTAASMTNLVFPLEWEEIFSCVGFPAYFKPYSGGGWKHVPGVRPRRVLRGVSGLRPARHDPPGGDRLPGVLPLLRSRGEGRAPHAVRPARAAREPLRA